jgi:hypothetical protein
LLRSSLATSSCIASIWGVDEKDMPQPGVDRHALRVVGLFGCACHTTPAHRPFQFRRISRDVSSLQGVEEGQIEYGE